jgi:DNA ligase-associated metallophosphoesterase
MPLSLNVPDSPSDPPHAARHGPIVMHVAGERVELHADRALHWPGGRALFVADVHLGKAAAFRAGGVPLPRGTTGNDLARISALVAATNARTLVVLGDFLHARAGRVPALDDAFIRWREAHADLEVVIVRGNHDARAGDPPASWRVACVSAPHPMPPFLACHEPVAPPTGYALCGHVHPGVVLSEIAGPAARLPCFVIGTRRAILPAFGGFTGVAAPPAMANDTIVAIAGPRLFELPRAS